MRDSGKLVVLKFAGNLDSSGFRVTAEVGPQGKLPTGGIQGGLPANADLNQHLHEWRNRYRSCMGSTRLKTGRVMLNSTLNAFVSSSSGHVLEEIIQAATPLEAAFVNWLQSAQFSPIQTFLQGELRLDEDIQVIIQTDNHALYHLPWHSWPFIRQYEHAEIALSPLSFKRIHPPRHKKSSDQKVRILAILGNSEGIDTAFDHHRLKFLSDAKVVFLKQPSASELKNHLWQQSWDILFFAGHSEIHQDQGRLYLNDFESLTLHDLKEALKHAIAGGLQLAIFNSCDGLGLVRSLEQLNLPQIIVMREPIPDQVAQQFLTRFLDFFARGNPFHISVRAARTSLQSLEDEFPCATWLPIIFQHPGEISPTWADLRDYEPGQVESWSEQSLGAQHLQLDSKQQNRARVAIVDEATRHKKHQEAERLKALSRTIKVCDRITRDKPGHVKAWGSIWQAQLFDPYGPNTPISLDPDDLVHVVKRQGRVLFVSPGVADSTHYLSQNPFPSSLQARRPLTDWNQSVVLDVLKRTGNLLDKAYEQLGRDVEQLLSQDPRESLTTFILLGILGGLIVFLLTSKVSAQTHVEQIESYSNIHQI